MPGVPVYAHRGGTGAFTENTRLAFRNCGTRFWDTDVQFTKTDYPVLLHDPTLELFGQPGVPIAGLSLGQARSHLAADGQQITSLLQFTNDMTEFGVAATIELKTVPTPAQWEVLDLQLASNKPWIILESFLDDACAGAIKRGYETCFLTKTTATPDQLPAGTRWYGPKWENVTAEQIAVMRAAGVKVVAWTPTRDQWPDDPAGLDALISNDVP